MGIRKVGGNKCGKGLTRNSFEWIYCPPDMDKRNVQSSIPRSPIAPDVECDVTYVLEDYVICDYVV